MHPLNLIQRPPKTNLLALHLPKTGGTSIVRALTELYFDPFSPGRKYRFSLAANSAHETAGLHGLSDQQVRDVILRYATSGAKIPYRLVTGHFRFTATAINRLSANWLSSAVLREPTSRWLSDYYYNRFKTSLHFKTDLDLEQYLDSNKGLQSGRCYVTIFQSEGPAREISTVTRSHLEEAKNNLRRISLLGLLEDLDDFQDRLQSALDRKLYIGVHNRNPAPKSKSNQDLDDYTIQRIAKICEPDIEVYKFAQDLLRKG